MRRNRGVVYSGRVGARMRARKQAVCRRIFVSLFKCKGGPLRGYTIALSGTGVTLPFTVRGVAGHYAGSEWHGQRVGAAA